MFQVNVIDGNSSTFNALAFGEKHPGTLRFLESQFENFGQTLNTAGQAFFENARELYNQINSSAALRAARQALEKVRGVFERDDIHCIWKVEKLQNAGFTMQRWIMADPVTREMFQQQRCDGYSNSYVDVAPGCIGENHYDYRRVMHGMVQDHPEHDWKTTFYLDDLSEEDRELTLDEKVDILSTWDIVRMHLKNGKDDPTSQFGSML